jgi:protein TonB
MENFTQQYDSYLDGLFANRNKDYGAYILRKYYPQRLIKSVVYAFLLVVILFISFAFAKKETVVSSKKASETVEIQTATDQKKEKPKAEQEKPRQHQPKSKQANTGKQNSFTSNFKLVEDKTIDLFNDDAANNPNGNNLATTYIFGELGGETYGDGPTPIVDTTKTVIPVVEPIQPEVELPSFEAFYKGGQEALGTYLQDKLGDETIDDEALVFQVTFTVHADNKVGNVLIEGDIDDAVKTKAKRCFEKMKNWQTAMQSGNAVSTTRTMNIKIIAND